MPRPRRVPVPGFEKLYRVSCTGIVTSVRTGKPLAHYRSPRGDGRLRHPYVTLKADGKKCRVTIHRLVCEAFHGPPPFEGAMVLHRDDDNLNNRWGNLYWGTERDNAKDRHRNGKQHSKLTARKVLAAKARRAKGETIAAIAKHYGVGVAAMSAALAGKTWMHLCESTI